MLPFKIFLKHPEALFGPRKISRKEKKEKKLKSINNYLNLQYKDRII